MRIDRWIELDRYLESRLVLEWGTIKKGKGSSIVLEIICGKERERKQA